MADPAGPQKLENAIRTNQDMGRGLQTAGAGAAVHRVWDGVGRPLIDVGFRSSLSLAPLAGPAVRGRAAERRRKKA